MLDADLDSDIGRQLRDLTDRQSIADLIAGLGIWLDEKRFDDARSILTEDVTIDSPGGSTQGIDRVADQARRNHGLDLRTQHLITDALIEIDGDRATAGANMVATFVDAADAPAVQYALGARYGFEAVRTSEGWRLSRIRVVPVWSRGVSPVAPAPDGGRV